jgi:hypothetical protein
MWSVVTSRRLLLATVLLALPSGTARAALDLTAPDAGTFPATEISGLVPQTIRTSLSGWSVNATGTLTGWHVDIGASQFQALDGSKLPLQSMTLKGPVVSAGSGQLLSLYPLVLVTRLAPVAIDRSAAGSSSVTFVNALSGTGSGVWNFAQGAQDLELTIPVTAKSGTYSSTITFTLSPGPA